MGPEQNYAVKGRSTQNILYLMREIIEGIENDTKVVLISLDHSKAFDRVEIGFWRRFWRLPSSNRSFANGLAWCTTILRQRWRGTKLCLGFHDRKVALCPLYSTSSLWSPCSIGLAMVRQIQLCVTGRGSPPTLMISQSLCPAVWT